MEGIWRRSNQLFEASRLAESIELDLGTQVDTLLDKCSCTTKVDHIDSPQRNSKNFTSRKDLHALERECNSVCLTWSAN